VTYVQEIEESVRQDDAGPRAETPPPRDLKEKAPQGENASCGRRGAPGHARRTEDSSAGSERTARRNSSRLTVAVPRFMTTMPPA